MFLARIRGSGRKFCGAPKRQGSSEGEKANAPEAGPQGPGGEVGGRDAIFHEPHLRLTIAGQGIEYSWMDIIVFRFRLDFQSTCLFHKNKQTVVFSTKKKNYNTG